MARHTLEVEPWRMETTVLLTRRVLHSFRHWIGRELIPAAAAPEERARLLFEAPFPVLAHGIEPDPILNYGNRAALTLWEMEWDEFTRMPSRLTAEPDARDERARVLAEVTARGFSESYTGVRVSLSGKRFLIEKAIVWNVFDEAGKHAGQAATFSLWRML
jgi:hypothetical protein